MTAFHLSLREADILAELIAVNLRVFPFQLPTHGELVAERQQLGYQVVAALEERGLARQGTLERHVAQALRVLATFERAVVVVGTAGERTILARLAASGRHAVLVSQYGGGMMFEEITPESLAYTAVSLLPDLPGGPGQPVTISRPDEPRPDTFADGPAHAVRTMLERPRTGGGYFVTVARDRMARERRAPGLTWFDTDAGRYMVRPHPDGTGTYTPADRARLRHQLDGMLDSLRDR
ncbi:ESAT-6 protein secretion system EspG family protein [Herbihabitans rhizosphaerae]|uniref:ESAT-6 protein secretion system EspG family protein n=1 Tax=Herbihabitans rhizosphaerae TaxID=1872711 RepID=A0A4Q7L6E6_9PSEU|nr:ESX secretion-associated protein EspG [Herbihabitans rhizosphaerae]RZS44915.1 ESAT-6 protein secretion system EspG family protein [Herbihabitans rhizosphaerae]